jgi:hypothetical protein
MSGSSDGIGLLGRIDRGVVFHSRSRSGTNDDVVLYGLSSHRTMDRLIGRSSNKTSGGGILPSCDPGGVVARDGAGDLRAEALVPARIHGGNGDVVERGGGQTRELKALCLVRGVSRQRKPTTISLVSRCA